MATAATNVQLNITGNANQQLTKIQKQFDTLNGTFGKMRGLLAGISFGALFNNILKSADAMDDLAKATGLTTATIDGLSQALARNGGEVEDVDQILGEFSKSLEEGKKGTAKAEYQFDKLGISISELRNLSEEDILRKTIEGLAKMPAGAERTALALELLGKKARFIDWNNLNASLDMFIGNAKKAEPGTKALADLYDNLQGLGKGVIKELTVSGTPLIQTLVNLTKNTEELSKSLANITKVVAGLALAFGLLALPKKLSEFGGFVNGLKKSEGTFQLVARGLNNVKTALQQLIYVFSFGTIAAKKWTGGVLVLGDVLTNLGKGFARLGAVGVILTTLSFIIEKLTGGFNPLIEAFKLLRDIGVVVAARLLKEWETVKIWFTDFVNFFKPLFVGLGQVIEPAFGPALNWLEKKLQDIASSWRQTVLEAEKTLGIAQGPVVATEEGEGAAKKMPFKFDEERKRRAEAAKEQATELEKLEKGIKNSTAAFVEQKNAQLAGLQVQASYNMMSEKQRAIIEQQRNIYDDFNNKIEEYKDKIEDLPPEHEKLRGVYLAEIETLKQMRDEQMKQATDAITVTYDQIEAQQDLQAELQRTYAEWRKITALDDLRAELDLLGLEGEELEKQQRLMETQKQMRDSVLDTVEKLIDLEQQKESGTISDEKYKREKSNLEKSLDLARDIAEGKLKIDEDYFAKKAALEQDFAAGAKKAATDSAKGMTPYEIALKSTQSVISNLENGLDEFAKTGKLKFGDLAKAILADLAKIALQAALNPVFTKIGSGIGSFIGSLFGGGKAEGGPVKGGIPYIVGEKGPELFVPQGSGTVVPNKKLNGGTTENQVSAPITNNYITNNISALDAKSVAQLFAENRKTLLGSVKMAEREMPYAAR